MSGWESSFRIYRARLLGWRTGLAGLWWMLLNALSAPSFADFWARWNPWTSYALRRWVYRPARRALPRAPATLLTFAVSGFVFHDLPFWWGWRLALAGEVWPPFATVWFTAIGVAVLASRALGEDFGALTSWQRAARHIAVIVACTVPAFAFSALIGAPPGW